MVKTPSSMMPLGTKAPDFSLIAPATGKQLSLSDLKSDTATVIIFMCNHCPFVIHIIEQLAAVATEYQTKGIHFVAINSNDVENYPDDAPEKMAPFSNKYNMAFPYLFDDTQEVAKAYDAACTPDFFVFDGDLKCVYRGQFDDSRPGNGVAITGKDLTQALDCLLENQSIPAEQKPSIGCNIKWKERV